MKKGLLILLFFTALAFTQSCGDDDKTGSSSGKNKYFNPPEWVQGTWSFETSVSGFLENYGGFIFTEDDFIVVSSSIETSHKKLLEQGKMINKQYKVDETITATKYHFKMIMDGTTIEYKFDKVNNGKIEWVNSYSSENSRFYLIRK